jgi:hypothetical protein
MRRQSIAVLLNLILIILSLMIVTSSFAQTAKPSIPDFTLKYIDRSYDTQPIYSIDPYTGKSVITDPSYHVENKTIDITIKNQPFNSSKDASGNWTSLYYSIRFKGHFENDWASYPDRPDDSYINASLSDYTTVSLGYYQLGAISDGGQVDIQVMALLGHDNRFAVFGSFGEGHQFFFIGETSDWSYTQTISIPDGAISVSSSPNPTVPPTARTSQIPTSTPQQPNTQSGALFSFDWVQIALTLIGVAVVVLAFALVLSRKRNVKQNQVQTVS